MVPVYQREQLTMPSLLSTFRHGLPYLDAFSAAVSSAGVNVAVDIDSLLPSDHRQRYDRIQLLKQEMSSPAILATYAPGIAFIGSG